MTRSKSRKKQYKQTLLNQSDQTPENLSAAESTTTTTSEQPVAKVLPVVSSSSTKVVAAPIVEPLPSTTTTETTTITTPATKTTTTTTMPEGKQDERAKFTTGGSETSSGGEDADARHGQADYFDVDSEPTIKHMSKLSNGKSNGQAASNNDTPIVTASSKPYSRSVLSGFPPNLTIYLFTLSFRYIYYHYHITICYVCFIKNMIDFLIV